MEVLRASGRPKHLLPSRVFKQVREEALGVLWEAGLIEADDGTLMWIPCRWQLAEPLGHKAVYCNLTSNLEALKDRLREATWCDETVLSAHPADSEPVERLFRLYGVLFLLLDQCAMDLRDIWSAVDGSKRREPRRSGERVIGDFTNDANHIWRHRRDRHDRTGRRMHYDHHHGPYVFEGVPAEEGSEAGGMALLVVPSPTAAARSLADARRYTDGVMARSDAPERVVAE